MQGDVSEARDSSLIEMENENKAENVQPQNILKQKMTGGTPEVRSDKSLNLMTFGLDQWTNGPMD